MLLYNVPVQKAIAHMIGKTTADCEVKTYLSWLGSFYYKHKKYFHKDSMPLIQDYKPDWGVIIEDFKKYNKSNRGKSLYSDIIVDEAQDVPIELIQCLKLLTERVICFIDPPQTFKRNTTTVDALRSLFDNSKIEINLSKNCRNSKQIAEAAAIFSSNNLSYNFDDGKGPVTKPVMWDCGNNIDLVIKNMSDIIRHHYMDKSVGIILSTLPNSKSSYALMDRYSDLLQKELGDEYVVQCYRQDNKGNLDFSKKAIKIFTYNTDKGIDFDIALLPIIDPIVSSKNPDVDQNRVYVALTRGRQEVYLFYGDKVKAQTQYPVYDILSIIKQHKSKFDWWEITETFQEKYQ